MLERATSAYGDRGSSGIPEPIGTATGLPGRAYFDPAIYDRERQTIFRQSWMGIAYASDLPNPGDMMPITIAGWELLLVRTRDKVLRCFHNICRHRGMKLLDQPANGFRISCRYHCWTYGLDGALLATPHIGGPGINQAEGIEPETLRLREVRCEIWHDMVFADIDGNAAPLSQHFRSLDQLLADYDLNGLRVAPETAPEQEIPFNWKLQIEGGIESYHLPWVHPQLELPPPGYQFEIDDDDAYLGFKTPMSDAEMKRRAADQSTSHAATLPSFRYIEEKLARGEAPQFLIIFVLPNVTVVVMPNYLVLGLLRPMAVDKTAVRRKFYYVGEAANADALTVTRGEIAKIWYDILRQDVPFLTEIQKMTRVREDLQMPTRFSPYWEVGLREFQKYVTRKTKI